MTTGTEDKSPSTGSQPLGADKFKLPNRWIHSPAVRRYIYGIALATVPILVSYDLFTVEQGGLWLSLVGAALAITSAGVALVNTVERPEDRAEREIKEREAAIEEAIKEEYEARLKKEALVRKPDGSYYTRAELRAKVEAERDDDEDPAGGVG